MLDGYVAEGGNFIDTADSYMKYFLEQGNEAGQSETIIGDWLAARGNREDVVVATKVGDHPQHMGLAPATIKAAAEESLRRLRTDYIDLYYTHFDRDESIPVDDIIVALDDLVRAGKVRAIATSNISPERLSASLAFSDREGLARYVALQPQYNLVSRDTYEGARRDIVQREGLACVPYFALAAGFLTGKYRPGQTVESARNLPGLAGGYADVIVPRLDAWMARYFMPHRRAETVAAILSAQKLDGEDASVLAADQAIEECDRKLARYRAALEALDATADPARSRAGPPIPNRNGLRPKPS